MPMPTEERVSQLVAELVESRGFDLEGVAVSGAGKDQARVVVTIDSDATVDLDAVAELSTDVSEILDEAGDFGETPYLLEVTTPGVERPLTLPRHWRRARGRKARITLRADAPTPEGDGRFEARVGETTETEVALVLGGRRKPHRVHVPLADVERAVVQVEFSAPGAAEMELAGGVAPGRPAPGAQDDQGAIRSAAASTEGTMA
ncbi:ribosome maturation factor RimP [Nocardia macrotermitis]|uniref:Ribosome maturation factor RimP n=1 Tax=Nocardia macrotermitis TaxID=2585198 RepID=A0A7K0CYR0_9NOCA|nr:ribosome maturation factor RimP [Nocardia macrotermitis]MQY18629.1 Ribosome maturation factor RimP [Nocardia macrotermitis]